MGLSFLRMLLAMGALAGIRTPTCFPVHVLEPDESLFVIVDVRLAVSVTRIIVSMAVIARELDRLKHHQNAEASSSLLGLENRVYGRGRGLADIQKSHAEQPFSYVNRKLEIAAGDRFGNWREK